MNKYIFLNLSNGIEAIEKFEFPLWMVRFLRIQSTACEQKRWEHILNTLSPDFLLLAALGKEVVVYDFGARKKTSRAIWQGLEWVKFVLNKRWLGIEYQPAGRASSMGNYFYKEYYKLSKSTKAMLDYYGKYSSGYINIVGKSIETDKDGDVEYFKNVLSKDSGKSIYVVYNINGDVIGVANDHDKAISIYEERYYDLPWDVDAKIKEFPLNKMVYS